MPPERKKIHFSFTMTLIFIFYIKRINDIILSHYSQQKCTILYDLCPLHDDSKLCPHLDGSNAYISSLPTDDYKLYLHIHESNAYM